MRMGLNVKKVRRVISFRRKLWLAQYNDQTQEGELYQTVQAKKISSECCLNSTFNGKIIENVRNENKI